MEAASQVDTVVFDKTGTLTQGRPCLQQVLPTPGTHLTPAQLLAYAAAVERCTTHPVAQAIVQAARLSGQLSACATVATVDILQQLSLCLACYAGCTAFRSCYDVQQHLVPNVYNVVVTRQERCEVAGKHLQELHLVFPTCFLRMQACRVASTPSSVSAWWPAAGHQNSLKSMQCTIAVECWTIFNIKFARSLLLLFRKHQLSGDIDINESVHV